jgi:AcrR family transcriptional regulator
MARLARKDWVRAACRTIGRSGAAAVKVEVLAKDLGVSKGSFYWHFDNRDALLQAVLSSWEQQGTDAIIEHVEAREAAPRDKLWRLILAVFQAAVPFDNFEAQLRAWAQSDTRAERTVRRVDRRRLDYVAGLLHDAGVPKREAKLRAELVYRMLVGELVLKAYGSDPLPERSLRLLWTMVLDGVR